MISGGLSVQAELTRAVWRDSPRARLLPLYSAHAFQLRVKGKVRVDCWTTGCVLWEARKERRRCGGVAAAAVIREKTEKVYSVLVSTGDVMGDIHGAALVGQVIEQARLAKKGVEVYGLGGQRMKAAGAVLVGDNTGLSSIGLLEALPLVVPSLQLQMVVRNFLTSHPPDVVVLIDYPGVNIPFGRYLKENYGCKVVYYIPPNEWLWNTSRTGVIVTMSDTILAVYKGEAEYYAKEGGHVVEVGHPLVDVTSKQLSRDEARSKLGAQALDIVVALIPASREQEMRHVWPIVADAACQLLESIQALSIGRARQAERVKFVIPVALPDQVKKLEESLEQRGLREHTQLWHGDSRVVLAASDLAITKSGSVNVELALFNVPQVVVYKIDWLSAWIARNIFKFSVQHVSLVNLMLGCKAVPEFIQEDAIGSKVAAAALQLLPHGTAEVATRNEVLGKYEVLRGMLGEGGAVTKAAKTVLACMH